MRIITTILTYPSVHTPLPLQIDKSIVDQIGQPIQPLSYLEFVVERETVHAAFDKMVQSTPTAKVWSFYFSIIR